MEKETRLMEMGKRIRAVRQSKEMSQDELARLCGYNSRSSINKIEAGLNDIPQSKIKAIADTLNVSPAWLMGYDDAPAAQLPNGNNPLPKGSATLSQDESLVLSKYRRLSPDGKEYIHDQLNFRLDKEAADDKKETHTA